MVVGAIRTRGVASDLILRDDDHQRGDARHGADDENDKQLELFDPIHLDLPQHDDRGEQQAEPEDDVNGGQTEGELEPLVLAAICVTLRFAHLNEGQIVAGTAHPEEDRIGNQVQC